MRRAVFLDRDGTLVEHVHHLSDARDLRLIQGAAGAVRRLGEAGFAVVLVTNQSVVGRGLLSEEGLGEIHQELAGMLREQGAMLDGIYVCSEVPNGTGLIEVEHYDRKPGPGMLLRAALDLGLALPASFMVGDSLSDMMAGRHAGCRATFLVQTGPAGGRSRPHPAVDYVVRDLPAAADLILGLPADGDGRAVGRGEE